MGGIDEFDPRWKCCCSSMHVKTGALVIAILGIICAVLQVGNGAYMMSKSDAAMGGAEIFGGLLSLTSCILVIYGIKKVNPCALVMHLVLLVLGMILVCIGIVIVIIAGAVIGVANEAADDTESEGWMAWLAALGAVILPLIGVLLLVILILQIWFFRVILRCRQYLQLEEMSLHGGGRVHPN